MQSLTNFTFNTHPIRVVVIDGEPWFVAVDAIRAIGLSDVGGAAPYLISLGGDEKAKLSRKESLELFKGVRTPYMLVISESGLYKLVMRSDKPQAKPFQDWVTKVVLPAIRKDGAYLMGEEKLEDFLLRPIADLCLSC